MRVRTARQRGSRAAARFDIDFVPASELLKAERQAGPEGPQGVGGAEVAASIASDDPKRVGKMYMQYIKDHPEARPPNRVVSLDSWRDENEGGERVITTPGSPRAKGRRQRPKAGFSLTATLGRFDTDISPAPSAVLDSGITALQRPADTRLALTNFGSVFPDCFRNEHEISAPAPVKVEFTMLPDANPEAPFADGSGFVELRRLQVRVPPLPTHPRFTSPMTDQEVRNALLVLGRGTLTYSSDPEDRKMAKDLEELLEFTSQYREAEQARRNPTGPF